MRINRNIITLFTAIILSTFTPVSIITTSASASFVKSKMVSDKGDNVSSREIDEIKVKRVLENKLVREKLKSSGMTSQEVTRKMEKMNDQEIHQIASLSDKIPSGGDGAVGFVVGVLVITVLVLVIIYLAKRV